LHQKKYIIQKSKKKFMQHKHRLLIMLCLLLSWKANAQNLSGKIIFSLQNSTPDKDSVCIIDPDGSNFQFITTGSYPRGSAAGTYLSFLRGPRPDRKLNDIYFREAGNTEYQYFDNGSQQPITNYDFSPSETTCIYDWQNNFYNQLSSNPNGQNIYNGSGAGDLFDCYPRISPVDSDLVFHNINNGLYLMSFTGVVNTPKIPNTQPGDLAPCWSPDGQWIYYGVQAGNNEYALKNIYRIHKDGTGKMQVTSIGINDTIGTGLVVTQNNKFIVAPARIGGIVGLYKFRTDTLFPQSAAYLIKAFPGVSRVSNLWLGNADSVTYVSGTTGLRQMNKRTGKIWPNPANQLLYAQMPGEEKCHFRCYNSAGKMVKEADLYSQLQIDISTLPPGNYFAELTDMEQQSLAQIPFTKQ
jgi:hypothetical protein